jgi:hypothetical protein
VIIEAERLSYIDKIANSNNTTKTTWNTIRVEMGINRLKDKYCKTEKINPSIFNNHFLNIADNITQKISTHITSDTVTNDYLNLTAKGPFLK